MRPNTTRTLNLLVVLALFSTGIGAVAGCGSDEADTPGTRVPRTNSAPPQVKSRARQVARAWDGSKAAELWHRGYHPLAEVIRLPESGLRNAADRLAFERGNFDLEGDLPSTPRKNGPVRWESGGSLTLPVMQAQSAYQALDRADNDGPRLVVTGARLGAMTLNTSSGPATVPAWFFALKGYDTPLIRAAVSPSKPPEPPIKSMGQVSADELAPLGGLVEVGAERRSVTVVATHGSCDDGPAVDVLETGGSIVLSASVTGSKDGACTGELRGEKVTVRLDKPVGSRIVLDAFTGRPVPYRDWPRASPTPG